MEITSSNFTEKLSNVKTAIENADFIAIDGEFTGLRSPDCEKINDLDTANQRYMKARHNVSKLGLIQFGLSTFKLDLETKKYKTATFCFYLQGKHGTTYCYEPSSMNFLAEHGFNFNKLFKEGLKFMSLEDEVKMINEMNKEIEETCVSSPLKVKDDVSRQFLKDATEKISNFVKDSEENALIIPGAKMNGFHRAIIYNNVAPSFENIHVETLTGLTRDIQVLKFDKSEDKEKYKREAKEKKIQDKLGFTEVIRHILVNDKPIVGHNMILDLLHMFDKFIMPLPPSLDEFKTSYASNFTNVYDTKLFAKDPPFCLNITNTSLTNLYESLLELYNPPTYEVDDGYDSYSVKDQDCSHDAGYDAFITGVCFSTMIKKLDGNKWGSKSPMKSTHIKHFSNKLNMMNSYDIPFINLKGPEITTDRSYIYEVTCPSDWNKNNIRSLFSKLSSFKLTWVNANLLYVIPQETDDVKNSKSLLSEIQASCPTNVYVSMYKNPECSNNSQATEKLDEAKIKQKRKSRNGHEDSPTSNPPRDLKRLKSVGSDKMSALTLESPVAVEQKLLVSDTKEKKESSNSDSFHVPDEW